VFHVTIPILNLEQAKHKPGHSLCAVRAQLKLIGTPSSREDKQRLRDQAPQATGDQTFLSGISLWTSTQVPHYRENCVPDPARQFCTEAERFDMIVGPPSAAAKTAAAGASDSPKDPSIAVAADLLEIKEYRSSVQIDLVHDGYAMVGELYPLQVCLHANQEQINKGVLMVTCDPPVPSKSDPFLFRRANEPFPLDEGSGANDLQPCEPLESGIVLAAGEQRCFDLFCLFGSLPYAASAGRKQTRSITIELVYSLPDSEVQVSQSFTHDVLCRLPFAHTVELVPRFSEQQSQVIRARAPCYVDLEIECCARKQQGKEREDEENIMLDRVDEIDVLGVTVEPSANTAVLGPNVRQNPADSNDGPGAAVSVFHETQRLQGGDRLCVGFCIQTDLESDQAVLGCVAVRWVRAGKSRQPSTMYIPLPGPRVEPAQLEFSVTTSPPQQDRVVGDPFHMVIHVRNLTEMAQELSLTVHDAPAFFRSGASVSTIALAPRESTDHILSLVPLHSGNVDLPSVSVVSARLMSQFTVPSAAESRLFVAPAR
jgi:hypothetical protein